MPWTLLLILLNLFAALFVQESSAVTIAVIDTGADTSHPQLAGRLWSNPGETGKDDRGFDKSTNGLDDDGNGFIDDVHGWNFANQNAVLKDTHGHGTHISGILQSVDPNAKLMIIKYYDPRSPGTANLANLIESLRYAVRMRADIINYSGGGFVPSTEEKKILQEAGRRGILVVAAAGNEASNSDRKPFYPADYGLPNLISVTAHDDGHRLLATSNYGMKSVSLAAPGFEILSTLPDGQWGRMTGTSQATAFVSGAAARLLEQRPDLKTEPARIAQHLLITSRYESSLNGKTRRSSALDLKRNIAVFDARRTFSGLKIQGPAVTPTLDSTRPSPRRTADFPLQ